MKRLGALLLLAAAAAPAFAAASKLLHHFLHLLEFAHELVDILDGGAAAFGNALATAGVENIGLVAFIGGHGLDDCLDALELFFGLVLWYVFGNL